MSERELCPKCKKEDKRYDQRLLKTEKDGLTRELVSYCARCDLYFEHDTGNPIELKVNLWEEEPASHILARRRRTKA